MESPEVLKTIIQSITVIKRMRFGGITLTLYDYPKASVFFYLYILTRYTLIAFRLWEIYVLIRPRDSRAGCTVAFYAQVSITPFLLTSSDIFITLRVYALTLKNKFVLLYFGSLAATKLATFYISTVSNPVGLFDLPQIPIPLDTFDACLVVPKFRLRWFQMHLLPRSNRLDLSAFAVVAWCTFRDMSVFRFSAVIRTIAAEATIYFFVMVALQIYGPLSFVLMEGIAQEVSLAAYPIINTVLTIRFAVSLKRAANPAGGQEWRLGHFSSNPSRSDPSPRTQASSVCESVEMDPLDTPNTRVKTYGP